MSNEKKLVWRGVICALICLFMGVGIVGSIFLLLADLGSNKSSQELFGEVLSMGIANIFRIGVIAFLLRYVRRDLGVSS